MSYALVVDDEIVSVGLMPKAARNIDSGDWILPYNGIWSDSERTAAGYYKVSQTERPEDTATDTFDRSLEIVDGVPTVIWTQRPMTQDELDAAAAKAAADAAQAAQDALMSDTEAQARTGFANNKDYLALPAPTGPESIAQVEALTRQVNGLIRIVVDNGLV